MGYPGCLIEVHGADQSYEVSSGATGDHVFGVSPGGDVVECRTEKRLSGNTPAGVFEIQLLRVRDQDGKTWKEKIHPQDVVVIQMMNYTGTIGQNGAGEMHTVMIGLVDSISDQTVISGRGVPQRVIQVRGRDFGKIFASGVVTYWSFLGAATIAEDPGLIYNFVSQTSLFQKRPDQVVAALVNTLFSKFMDIAFTVQKHPYSIFKALSMQLESYGSDVPAFLDYQFLNGEGNFWSFFTKIASPPFHELWIDTRRRNEQIVSTNTAVATSSLPPLALGRDGSCPTLIMRPTPFPYLTPQGQPKTANWDAIATNGRRHKVSADELSGESFDQVLTISDDEVFNFYLTSAQYPTIPDKLWLLSVPGILDQKKFKRYGYKPCTPNSSLLQASSGDAMGIFYTALNWRIASWNVLNDQFESGYKTFKLLPQVHVGDRLSDESDYLDQQKEYYVESVIHHYVYNQRATTTLGLTRGLRQNQYATIGAMLTGAGLEAVKSEHVTDKYKQLTETR